jgi:hypothetical protein
LAGAGPPYPAALIFWCSESEGDPTDVFDDSVPFATNTRTGQAQRIEATLAIP